MTPPTQQKTRSSLIDDLRQGQDTALEKIVREYRPRVVSQITRQGGSNEDAKDIFQEAMTALYLKSLQPDFQLTSSFYTFLYAICQNLWLKKIREKKRDAGVSIDQLPVSTADDSAQEAIEKYERHCFFMQKFAELGEECRKVLQLSIVEERDAREIKALLGFGSLRYLYKRKSNCKDKLLDLVRRDVRFNEFKT